MKKKYELTPKGLFFAREIPPTLDEIFIYLLKIDKNAIIFTKKGEAKFVKVEKVK